jgi:hypothetical protein
MEVDRPCVTIGLAELVALGSGPAEVRVRQVGEGGASRAAVLETTLL